MSASPTTAADRRGGTGARPMLPVCFLSGPAPLPVFRCLSSRALRWRPPPNQLPVILVSGAIPVSRAGRRPGIKAVAGGADRLGLVSGHCAQGRIRERLQPSRDGERRVACTLREPLLATMDQ